MLGEWVLVTNAQFRLRIEVLNVTVTQCGLLRAYTMRRLSDDDRVSTTGGGAEEVVACNRAPCVPAVAA
jgi:hypothetical protein